MSDIFLSYASEDRPWVLSFVQALERQGWSVWWDRTILPGKTFDQAIQEALDAAKCMIVVWSEASVQSDWVKTEAAEGVRRRILVPVLIDDVRLPLEFRRIQAAHLLDWHDTAPHQEFDKVVQAVTYLVGPQQRERTEAEAHAPAQRLYNTTKPRDEEPYVPILALAEEPRAVTDIPILPEVTPDRIDEEAPHHIPLLADLETRICTLTVHATPADSAIEIMNIRATYRPGIELAPGSYAIKVAREGYKTKCRWVMMSNADMVLDITLEPDPETDQQTPAGSVITLLRTDMEDRTNVELTPGPYDTQRQHEEDTSAHCLVTISDTDVALDLAGDDIPVSSIQKDEKVETCQRDERQQRPDLSETRESGRVDKGWLSYKCLAKTSFMTLPEVRYVIDFVQGFGKKWLLVWITVCGCLVLIPVLYISIPKGHEEKVPTGGTHNPLPTYDPLPTVGYISTSKDHEEPALSSLTVAQESGLTQADNSHEDAISTSPTAAGEPGSILANNSHEDPGRKSPIEDSPIVTSPSRLDTTPLPTPRIVQVVLAAGVKDRDPERKLYTQDSCSAWDNVQAPRIDLTQHRQIFLWTRVNSVAKQELSYTYYTTSHRDTGDAEWQKVDTVTLPIDSSESFRTWSIKENLGLGAWKVEITAASAPRKVLCTVYFDVVKTAGRKSGGLLSLFRR